MHAFYNNDLHLTLTTTRIAIQNGINQPCRVNTFWSIDDYVSKVEERSCMVLPLMDFLSKDIYAPKITDYGHILYVLNALMFFIPMNLAHQTPT